MGMYRNCSVCGRLVDDYAIINDNGRFKVICFDCEEKQTRYSKPRLKILGQLCGETRKRRGYTQNQVSIETGYSKETISSFENGRNNNCILLLWYIENGLDMSDVRRCLGVKGVANNGKKNLD